MDFPLPRCWPHIGRKRGSGLFSISPWSEVNWVGLDGRRRNEKDRSPDFLWSPEGLVAGTGHPSHVDSTPASSQNKVCWQQLDKPPASASPLLLLCLPVSIWMAEMNSGWVRWSRNPSFLPHFQCQPPSYKYLSFISCLECCSDFLSLLHVSDRSFLQHKSWFIPYNFSISKRTHQIFNVLLKKPSLYIYIFPL